jgi:hypothetical protein
MDQDPRAESTETPEAMLDRLRDHPEWSDRQREEYLGLLVERFPGGRVIEAVLPRLDDLGGDDAEILLRLIEANPEPAALDALARALERQPHLPVERQWEALAVLEGGGALDRFPSLRERWNDLAELFDDEDPVRELVEQIEGDPEGVWLALQGLGAIEPEVRSEIIEGLAGLTLGPGLVEFLRLLAYSPDLATRTAALSVLEAGDDGDDPLLASAWDDLAAHHPDPSVRSLAARSPGRAIIPVSNTPPPLAIPRPTILRSLVTAVDGRGRGSIALASQAAGRTVTVAFVCDVMTGVVDVLGESSQNTQAALSAFGTLAEGLDRESVRDQHELAIALLAGCLWLGGPKTPPSARYWVEAAVGPDLAPEPLRADPPSRPPESLPLALVAEESWAILEACPDWADASPLTVELAEEIRLREGSGTPDPSRDSGAYRFLFERRLKGQLELYRRMLLWMARLWSASARRELGDSAQAIAWQLSDAQHVVPGHPFNVALTTRSLTRASRPPRDAPGRPPRGA